MVNPKIIELVKKYLTQLKIEGVPFSRAFIYGSQARGTAGLESDIDLMIISPSFDEDVDPYISRIWFATRAGDYRIEPVAVGEKRFQEDDVSPLLEVVRQEGIEITI